MDKIEQGQLYTDFASLDELRKGGLKNDQQALRKAAEHFESIFMKMMLKSMRQAEEVLADEDSPFNSQTAKFYRDMHDDQMAMELSRTGSLGLADLIVEQMSPQKGKYMPADSLRSDTHWSSNNKEALDPSVQVQLNNQTLLDSFNAQAADKDQQPTSTNPIKLDEPSALLSIFEESKQPNIPSYLALPSVSKLQVQPQHQVQAKVDSEPQPVTTINFESKHDFVRQLLPVAEKLASKIGLPAQALIAQAALETGWGQKMIKKLDGTNALNFFGIKADSRWEGEKATVSTLEYKNGVAQQQKAQFRAYENVAQGLSDYIDFISSNPRYSEAVDKAQSPEQYFKALQNAGYATDPNYAQKIMSVLKDSVFEDVGNMLKF